MAAANILILFPLICPHKVQLVQNNWRKQKPSVLSELFLGKINTLALEVACGNKPSIALKFDTPEEPF